MDEDLIVVDDVEYISVDEPTQPQAGPSTHSAVEPQSLYETSKAGSSASTSNDPNVRNSARLRNSSTSTYATVPEPAERTTRSRSKPQPKLTFKLSEKAAAQAPGMSFLGQYDRELDSDDEELAFEEQFILRMPPGEDCDKLRKMIASREVPNDVWFKFKDSRRAMFHMGANNYNAKLVDLPCIIESQKTLDNKQMFKVADICQMLVVDQKQEEGAPAAGKGFNIDEFIWPHGITPPLHHVRKRRFRKRINKRTIESVEQEVERLLDEDAMAAETNYVILENVNPDLSDSEFIERDEPIDAPTPAISDMGEAATPGDYGEPGDGSSDEDGDIDEQLVAELDQAFGDEEEEDGDDDDDDDDDSDEEEEDDDDDDETSQARKLLNEEIRDLEAAVAKKGNEIASSVNPLIKKRFEDALKKLSTDLEMKLAQREEMTELEQLRKQGIEINPAADSDEESGDEDPGPPPPDTMDIL